MYLKFHGDSSRGNSFWVYPSHLTLINTKWDCHNPEDICTNFEYVGITTSDNVLQFRCKGHSTLYHGDKNRNHYIFVYPKNHCRRNLNCWDTTDVNLICDNYKLVEKKHDHNIYQCLGH